MFEAQMSGIIKPSCWCQMEKQVIHLDSALRYTRILLVIGLDEVSQSTAIQLLLLALIAPYGKK